MLTSDIIHVYDAAMVTFAALIPTLIAVPQTQGEVLIKVEEGKKLRYEIVGTPQQWGADDDGRRFLMPARGRGSFKLVLSVEVQKPSDTLNFQNNVEEYSEGGRKALAQFGADGRSWPSWSDLMGVMSLSEIETPKLETDTARSGIRSMAGVFGPAAGYAIQGRFIYTIPLGLNFREKPWALADDKYVVYKWTKDGDFADIEITKSKAVPLYGDEDYGKDIRYVTGRARLSLKDGLLVSSEIVVDDGTRVVKLASRRLAD